MNEYKYPTAQQLAEWCVRCLSFETVDDMADEIAIQMPSPGEFQVMDIPERAKALRVTLLHEVHEATSVEEAREILFRMAEALVADPTA